MKLLQSTSARAFAALSSLTLAGILIGLLALLTFLGTLEQAEFGLYEVQRKYFESAFLMHDVGPLSIPLPGGGLVMGLLFVNLALGGVLRLRRGAATAGVLTAHVGMLGMLFAGFTEYAASEDGHSRRVSSIESPAGSRSASCFMNSESSSTRKSPWSVSRTTIS